MGDLGSGYGVEGAGAAADGVLALALGVDAAGEADSLLPLDAPFVDGALVLLAAASDDDVSDFGALASLPFELVLFL